MAGMTADLEVEDLRIEDRVFSNWQVFPVTEDRSCSSLF